MRLISPRSISRRLAGAALVLGALALSPGAEARPSYLNLVPWGPFNACANCHLNPEGGGPRNPFGMNFQQAGFDWTPELAALDSDGDGFTNGEELNNPSGDWNPGDDDPGDLFDVSSPGRSESVPGEHLLTITEVRRSPGNEFFVELTNLSGATQVLNRKWLVFGAEFGEGPLPGQMRVVAPDGPLTTMAPGEVATYMLEPAGLPAGTFDENNGFVALLLFEDQRNPDPPANIDPAFSWFYGDYVEWGPVDKPYNFAASNSGFLPQWDSANGLPSPLPLGGGLEHNLVTQGIRGWYSVEQSLTFGQARPVAALATDFGLQFPFTSVGVGSLPVGFEAINFSPLWDQPDWPLLQGVVVEPGLAIAGAQAAERTIRLSNLTSGEAVGRSTAIMLPGVPTLDQGGAAVSLDVAFPSAPTSAGGMGADGDQSFAVSFSFSDDETADGLVAEILFTSEDAVLRIATGAETLYFDTLFSYLDLDPTAEWTRITLEAERAAADRIDVTATVASRDGSSAFTHTSSWSSGAFDPDEGSGRLYFRLPSGFSCHAANFFARSETPEATGFALR